jgi:two-component system, LytTR family, sensor kinase
MPLSISFPKYHSKDLAVLAASLLPGAVILNYFLYGTAIFDSVEKFAFLLIVTFLYISVMFACCGWVAITLRNRFPADSDLPRRILICLGIFYLMSAAFISILLLAYDATGFFGYNYREFHFYKTYAAAVIINTFLTFLNEGIYRFEKLAETVKQTEQLKREYMKSRLLGLKSQMNPHFLFNSLNTLSSLIQEDDDRAEEFLNHMSKVYRYLLRYRDEKLVALETELYFARSYYHLLKQRYGEGIHITTEAEGRGEELMIAPFTLQMLIDDTVGKNTISRSEPLEITIRLEGDRLLFCNSLHCRIGPCVQTEAMENILAKYKLLCEDEVRVEDDGSYRVISLPLIHSTEMEPA